VGERYRYRYPLQAARADGKLDDRVTTHGRAIALNFMVVMIL